MHSDALLSRVVPYGEAENIYFFPCPKAKTLLSKLPLLSSGFLTVFVT